VNKASVLTTRIPLGAIAGLPHVASDIDRLVMDPLSVEKPEGYQAAGSHLSPDRVD
jgi:hypothetical protein